MAYRIAAIPMTFSDLEGNSSTGILLNAIVYTTLEQLTRFQFQLTAHCAVPWQQLS